MEDRQVWADPEKIKIIENWPVPENRKKLQRFISFANFYRQFIHKFSTVAAPLNSLT